MCVFCIRCVDRMLSVLPFIIPSSASPFQGEDTSLLSYKALLIRFHNAASIQQPKKYYVTLSLKNSS